MSIERADGLNQVCCDTCPASYPNTYADEDFSTMIADAKTAGWLIRPGKPDADKRDTTDLFGKAPRIAGNQPKPQRFMHFCPGCKLGQHQDQRLF